MVKERDKMYPTIESAQPRASTSGSESVTIIHQPPATTVPLSAPTATEGSRAVRREVTKGKGRITKATDREGGKKPGPKKKLNLSQADAFLALLRKNIRAEDHLAGNSRAAIQSAVDAALGWKNGKVDTRLLTKVFQEKFPSMMSV